MGLVEKIFIWEKYILSFCLAFILIVPYSKGQEVQIMPEDSIFDIKENFQQSNLGRYILVLECQNKPSLAKIMRDSINYPFKTNYEEVLKFVPKTNETAYWIHFNIKNETSTLKELILEIDNPLLEEIEFFEIQEKIDAHFYTGNRYNFKTRPIKHRNFIFKINLAPNEKKTYYAYLNQQGKSITIPVKLYSQERFMESNYKSQLILGFTNGFFFFLILLSIFLYFNLWHINFLNLFFYTLTLWLFSLNNTGLAFQYLWGNFPEWGQYAIYILAEMNTFFAACLVYRLLLEYNAAKFLIKVSNGIAYFSLIWAFLSLVLIYFENSWIKFLTGNFPLILLVFMNGMLFVNIIYNLLQKTNSLSYVILAINLFLLGLTFYFYLNYTTPSENYYASIAFCFGCGAMLINLLLGLTHRIQYFNNEEELQKLLSINKLRAMNEEKAKAATREEAQTY